METSRSSALNVYDYKTIIDALYEHSKKMPNELAVTVVEGDAESSVTYHELLQEAVKAKSVLSYSTKVGDRVLLAMPTCLEFIFYYFGCLLSARIPVPIPVEKSTSRFSRLRSVVNDAKPSIIVFKNRSDCELMPVDGVKSIVLSEVLHNNVNDVDTSYQERITDLTEDHIALIQYTSGSTGNPKGVVLTHKNLIENIRMIQIGMQITSADRIVSWLPLYHDMGLIGMLLTTISTASHTILFAPKNFSKQPIKWLSEITKRKATLSGAPNFAFEVLADRNFNNAEFDIDLSSLRLLFCGSERIVQKSILNFYNRFSKYGLKSETFFPCYGLAEAALYVSGRLLDINKIDNSSIKLHDSVFVSCGFIANGLQVNLTNQNSDGVGEVEIIGPSVTLGYWRDVASEVTNGTISNSNYNKSLNTGDLGLIKNNQLYICGRTKDLIKIRGINYYAEDIELFLQPLSNVLPNNTVIAISNWNNIKNSEEVIIVAEVSRTERKSDFSGLLSEVNHFLSPSSLHCERLIVLAPASMPRTSNGKKQRQLIKKLFINKQLDVLWDTYSEFKKVELNTDSNEDCKNISDNLNLNWLKNINYVLADEQRRLPSDFFLKLHQSKLLSLYIPRQYGGLGCSHKEYIDIAIELSRINVTMASAIGVHNTIGVMPIVESKVLIDKNEVLSNIVESGLVAAFAITEKGAGSNPRAITSRIEKIGGKYILNGEKVWIGNAGVADLISVFAQEYDDQGRALGISAFLLRKNYHSYVLGPEQLTLGLRSMTQNTLVFNNVLLDERDRLSLPGKGIELAYKTMDYARFGLLAVAIGSIDSGYNKSLQYAKSRDIATGRLIQNSHFIHEMNEIWIKRESLYNLSMDMADLLDSTGEMPKYLSLTAKILSGEWGFDCVDKLLQFLGGRGYTENFGLSAIWRDIRIVRIFEGPTEALAFQLGHLFKRNKVEMLTKVVQPHILLKISDEDERYNDAEFCIHIGLAYAHCLVYSILLKNSKYSQFYADILKLYKKTENELSDFVTHYKKDSELKLHYSSDYTVPENSKGLFDDWYEAFQIPNKNVVELKQNQPAPHGNQEKHINDNQNQFEVENNILSWLSGILKLKQIDKQRPLREQGVDSLLAYELICYIEDEYKITIPESIISESFSFNDISNLLNQQLNTNSIKRHTK